MSEDTGTHIWITQRRGDELTQIVDVIAETRDATAATFERLERIFGASDEAWPEEGEVLAELTLDDDLQERKCVMSASQAEWLLGEFFKLPKSHWKALRVR